MSWLLWIRRVGLGGLGIIIGERDFPFIPRVDLVVVAWLEEMLGRFKKSFFFFSI